MTISWINFPYKKQAIEIGIVVILLAIAFASGRFLTPSKIKTVTVTKTDVQIQWKDRVVTKTVYQTKYVKVKDTALAVDTTTSTTKKPDGTVTTTTTTHEQLATQTSNSQVTNNNSNTTTVASGDKNKESETTTTKVVDNTKPSWMFNLTYGYNSNNFNNLVDLEKPVVGIVAQKRIIGPVFVGLYGQYDLLNTAVNAGITAGLEL